MLQEYFGNRPTFLKIVRFIDNPLSSELNPFLFWMVGWLKPQGNLLSNFLVEKGIDQLYFLCYWAAWRVLGFVMIPALFIILHPRLRKMPMGLTFEGMRTHLWIYVALFIPVFIQTRWVAFFNTIFQGTLFSLLAPLLTYLFKRIIPLNKEKVYISGILPIICCLIGSVNAQNLESELPANTSKTSIVIPYNSDQNPLKMGDPLAFIGREDFSRLWRAAQHKLTAKEFSQPFLAELNLEGSLSVETLKIVVGIFS